MAAGGGKVYCYVMNEPFQVKCFSLPMWLLMGACAPVDGPISMPIWATLMRLSGLSKFKKRRKKRHEIRRKICRESLEGAEKGRRE